MHGRRAHQERLLHDRAVGEALDVNLWLYGSAVCSIAVTRSLDIELGEDLARRDVFLPKFAVRRRRLIKRFACIQLCGVVL